MTCIDSVTFLENFPQFNNLSTYPQSMIDFWLDYSVHFINFQRWGSLASQGVQLLTAHNLLLASQGGVFDGLDTGQSVDVESYTTEVNAILIDGAGMYNKTVYGVQYYQLARLIGAGPLQII